MKFKKLLFKLNSWATKYFPHIVIVFYSFTMNWVFGFKISIAVMSTIALLVVWNNIR